MWIEHVRGQVAFRAAYSRVVTLVVVNGVCPECGLPGVPYLYGYPSDEGLARAEAGRVVLGGCVVWAGQPDFQCPNGHEWAVNPVRPKKPRSARRATPAQPTFATEAEATASAAYAAGRYDEAAAAYRGLLDAATERHGASSPKTVALRHALAIVQGAQEPK